MEVSSAPTRRTHIDRVRCWLTLPVAICTVALALACVIAGPAIQRRAAIDALESNGASFKFDGSQSAPVRYLRSWLGDAFLTYPVEMSYSERNATDSKLSCVACLQTLQKIEIKYATSEEISHLRGLLELRSLHIHGTPVSDEEFMAIAEIPQLEELYLHRIEFSDTGFGYLQKCPRLKLLSFHGTKVTDYNFRQIVSLTDLRYLRLDGAHVTDFSLNRIPSFTKLEHLDLHRTLITDSGLVHLRALPRLRSLNVHFTKISDRGLEDVRTLKSLRSLRIYGTGITREGAVELQRALPKCRIHY